MDKDLCRIVLCLKHIHTCGIDDDDDDDDRSRQLLLKSETCKWLIARNVKHTRSSLVPDEQALLCFLSHHTQWMRMASSFADVRTRERETERAREEEAQKALGKQSQIRRTCVEVTTTTRKKTKGLSLGVASAKLARK